MHEDVRQTAMLFCLYNCCVICSLCALFSVVGTEDTFIINFVCDQNAATPSPPHLFLEEMGTSTHGTHNIILEMSTALACEPAPVDCQVIGKAVYLTKKCALKIKKLILLCKINSQDFCDHK